ncbi:unnamed protein product [Dovyalis caffra]|uniref:Kinesin light chain n=1 Tax=Dovyalis caffra TaxID=77055 RepID=A0AAV1RSG0_9ROSI|nr:unnamed protein product [Dovyalis caffra]
MVNCKTRCSYKYGSGGSSWRMNSRGRYLWTILAGQAAIILGINAKPVLADELRESSSENDSDADDMFGFRKIEDGSGKLDLAEKFFFSALQEAKEGFGEKDPHVASSCNNLAELFRVQKQFDKAEPLYWEAIKILEESFGPEDIRVGAALHNLGQFYLMQRKLDEAAKCYEHAMKIKRRVLGLNHTDYADTLYHLGMVLYLLGKEKDAEALIQESIKILEVHDYAAQLVLMYLKSNRLPEAENVQRKVLQIMELSKGWNSMDTVIVAERLALTLQSIGQIKEAKELLERCLEARKSLLPEDHIQHVFHTRLASVFGGQIAANLLHIARVAMLNSNRLRRLNISEAIAELDKAKDLLHSSTRIARQVLNKLRVQKGKKQKNGASEMKREGHAALIILWLESSSCSKWKHQENSFCLQLQSLDALGLLETTKQELLESECCFSLPIVLALCDLRLKHHERTRHPYYHLPGEHLHNVEAENVLLQCISSYKEFEAEKLISDSPKVKTEYLSCLKHLMSLMIDAGSKDKVTLKNLDDEIKRVQAEISGHSKHKP